METDNTIREVIQIVSQLDEKHLKEFIEKFGPEVEKNENR